MRNNHQAKSIFRNIFLLGLLVLCWVFTTSYIHAVVPDPHKILIYKNGEPLEDKFIVLKHGVNNVGICEQSVCFTTLSNNVEKFTIYVFDVNVKDTLSFLSYEDGKEIYSIRKLDENESSKAEHVVDVSIDPKESIIFKYDMDTDELLALDSSLWEETEKNPLETGKGVFPPYINNISAIYVSTLIITALICFSLLVVITRKSKK